MVQTLDVVIFHFSLIQEVLVIFSRVVPMLRYLMHIDLVEAYRNFVEDLVLVDDSQNAFNILTYVQTCKIKPKLST